MTRQGGRTLAFVRKVNAMKEKPLAKLDADALWAEAEEAIYNFKYAKTDPDGKFRAKAQACFIECDLARPTANLYPCFRTCPRQVERRTSRKVNR